jgi:hypothetical protein
VPKSLVEKYRVCLRISVSPVVNDPVEADILPLIKLLIASPNIDPSYVVSQDLDQALPANFIEDDEIEIKAAGDLNPLIARLDPQPWDESVFIKPYISDYLTAPSYWLPRDGVAIATHLVQVRVKLGRIHIKSTDERKINFHFEVKQGREWISSDEVMAWPDSSGVVYCYGADNKEKLYQGRWFLKAVRLDIPALSAWEIDERHESRHMEVG